jgi:hypothetical protein
MKPLEIVQIVAALLLSTTILLAKATCTGSASFPTQNEICLQQTTEKSCLSKFAYETEFIADTCRWVTQTGAVTTEIQDTYTEYGTTWFSNITWPKGATSFALKVTLPVSAKNKWSGYLSLQSGPQNVSLATKYMDPKRSFTFSGCQTGTTCELKQTVPKNVFPSKTFRASGVIFTAMTTDPVLINQFNTNGHVDDTYPFKLRFETTTTTAAGSPAATPAISDTIQFGPTDYIMDGISPFDANKRYSVVTYKSYEISNVAEASWKVNVGTSLAANLKKTNITSMLLTEKSYYRFFGLKQQYLGKCTSTCSPPTSLAIKGTVCTGLACSKSAIKLDTTQKYRLLVSYPSITSLGSETAYSEKPMTSKFNKEMVKTEVSGKGWKLLSV